MKLLPQALRIDPGLPGLRYRLGLAYTPSAMRRPPPPNSARPSTAPPIPPPPNSREAVDRAPDSAAAEFREAVDRAPDSAAAHNYLGIVLFESGAPVPCMVNLPSLLQRPDNLREVGVIFHQVWIPRSRHRPPHLANQRQVLRAHHRHHIALAIRHLLH